MIFGPLNVLLYLVTTAISLSILGGGIYFVWGWYEAVLVGIGYLVAGVVMIVLSFLGKYPVMYLLGRRRPNTRVAPMPDATVHRIARPNGSELNVEEFGPKAGPALILTHGLSFNSGVWRYLIPGLSTHYRVFAWDMPAFGKSSNGTGVPYTLEMLADDLHAVTQLAGAEQVVLAGHSMGGMVTLTYCRQYREQLGARVAGLILAQTSYTNPVKTALLHRLLTAMQVPVLRPLCYLMIVLSPILWLANLQSYLSGMAHIGTHLTGYSGSETPEQLDFASRFSIISSPASTARALLAMFRYDALDILPTIPTPALVITGDHDIITLPSAGEVIHRSLPGSARLEITSCGHLGLLEQSERYTETIEGWVGACLAGAPVVLRSA